MKKKMFRIKYTLKGQEGFSLYFCTSFTRTHAREQFFAKFPNKLVDKFQMRVEPEKEYQGATPDLVVFDEVKEYLGTHKE